MFFGAVVAGSPLPVIVKLTSILSKIIVPGTAGGVTPGVATDNKNTLLSITDPAGGGIFLYFLKSYANSVPEEGVLDKVFVGVNVPGIWLLVPTLIIKSSIYPSK